MLHPPLALDPRTDPEGYGVPVTVNVTELVPTVAFTVAAPAVAAVVRVTEVLPVASVVELVALNVPPPVVVHVTVAPLTAVPPVDITCTTRGWVAVPAFTDCESPETLATVLPELAAVAVAVIVTD